MTTHNPNLTTDLAALEAQVSQLTDPATLQGLDEALRAQTAPALLADEAALLADLRLATLLDAALSANAAPAGLAERILAAAPLHEAAADVAGKITPAPAVKGRVGGAWMARPWRYAAVASISFSLSLMAITFIVKKEAPMLAKAFGGGSSSVSDDLSKLQLVVLDSGISDEELEWEMEQTRAEWELAGL